MKALVIGLASVLVSSAAFAQQVQIPSVQACNFGNAEGTATVYLSKRKDINSSGNMEITLTGVGCDPITGDGHPSGEISMSFSLSESSISNMRVTLIEQMTTVGKHTTTTYMNGRCLADGGVPCHFWLTLTDNHTPNVAGTPDTVGVLVLDKKGTTMTYGTGPVRVGDISVTQY